ncbi:sugar transferase [Aerococcus viridans]|uniref:Bacterial sugar transferase domain-containing protein n=1 Tax=Aerococcus viridans TaxID=1377 RepID=A0A2J9PNL6_9LACT|nr:sugar transferase [Aerococcus viridans]MEB7388999.1 sugar transferase [Aerococcus viridans]PNL91954.1 hypothetical protein A6J77_006825 [Aerococcus viridans]
MGVYKNVIKRILDVVVSGLLLVILLPLLLFISLLIKIKLGSPVIFSQDRPGQNEKNFKMYKFRTMTNERDSLGQLLPDAKRLTGFGKKLRRTSLDELPELWNIFIGNMSFVGPRPLLIRYLPYYTIKEKQRHNVKPGLTGLSQVNGRNNLEWNRRLALDSFYANNVTFLLDLKIILKTFIKVFKKSDIADGDELEIRSLDIERNNENRLS